MHRGQFPRHLKGTLPHSLTRTWPHLSPLHSTRVVTPRLGHSLGSFTPKRTFVESAVTHTQELITTFHFFTGTSWYITIALVAFGVNLVRLPFVINTRRMQQRRLELTPLNVAWYNLMMKSVHTNQPRAIEQLEKEAQKKTAKKMKKIYSDFGLQAWKAFSSGIITIPIWLGVMESLRRLCGGPTGLIGALFFNEGEVTDATAIAGLSSDTSSLANAASTAVDTASTAGISTIADVAIPAATTLEPSLATGGLLWFPDLLIPDPYHVLPWLLSFTMAANLGLVPTSVKAARELLGGGPLEKYSDKLNPRTRLRRILLICSISIAPVTMYFPAALHVYWICTSCMSALMTEVIFRCMPLPAPTAVIASGQHRVMLLPRPEKEASRRLSVFD